MGNTKRQSGSRQIGGRPVRLSPADLRKASPTPAGPLPGAVPEGPQRGSGGTPPGFTGPVRRGWIWAVSQLLGACRQVLGVPAGSPAQQGRRAPPPSSPVPPTRLLAVTAP